MCAMTDTAASPLGSTAAPAIALDQHRAALTGHCYRMLGSLAEADDAVQETMVRAWRGLDRFDGRASLRTWLYRIATNVCLDALQDRSRRERPIEMAPAGTVDDPLAEQPRSHWLEPILDARAVPADGDPSERAILRQSIRLAFVAALQHLPPRQRAALLLAEVLGWSVAEVADTLETSVPAVNSSLQRARATLAARGVDDEGPPPLTEEQADLLDRYVELFERYDVDGLAALLREDATFSMPPYALWLRGPDPFRAWLLGRGAACRGSRMIPVGPANGLSAFAQYKRPAEKGGPYRAWALAVLELSGGQIASWTSFLDVRELFPRLGLPLELGP
jgi:RNA polymerase sigma-70 factor (ECF subfamily)